MIQVPNVPNRCAINETDRVMMYCDVPWTKLRCAQSGGTTRVSFYYQVSQEYMIKIDVSKPINQLRSGKVVFIMYIDL